MEKYGTIEAWKEEYERSFKALKHHVEMVENADTLLNKQVETVYIQREAKHMDRLLRRIKAAIMIVEEP